MDTLVVEPYWTEIPAHFGVSLAELQRRQDAQAWIDFELGVIDEPEFCQRFLRDGPVDRDALVASVRAAYRWVDGMDGVLAELAAGCELHALSNYPIWYRLIEERLELSRHLTWSFVSCDHGVRKPDARLFRIALEQLGVAAGECLFVDDREENCAAARELGLEVELFRSADEIRERFRDRGLI